jgi:hypothetical protein
MSANGCDVERRYRAISGGGRHERIFSGGEERAVTNMQYRRRTAATNAAASRLIRI